jgi:hypothetical protein
MLVIGNIYILFYYEVKVIYLDFFEPIMAGKVWMKYSSPKAD